MKNVSVRENANGSTSIKYRRQFKGHVHQLPFNQLSGATLTEKFAQIKAINKYLERVYALTESRTSMMDIITAHKHITITGTPNKNARVVMYRGKFNVSWSVNKYGLIRAINIAIASLLTILKVNDSGNRVILGAVIRNRVLEEYNEAMYNVKRFKNVRDTNIQKQLSTLYSRFKKDKHSLSKADHIHSEKLKVEAYIYVQYRMVTQEVYDAESKNRKWESKVMKCVVLDSINSEFENQGNFKAYVNEVIKFASRCKFDAVQIVNVLNPDFDASLVRNGVFTKAPTSVIDGVGHYDKWQSTFVRILTDFSAAPMSARNPKQ